MQPRAQSQRHSAEEWEALKPSIEKLYVEEDRTLKDVMGVIGQEFGILASYDSLDVSTTRRN